MSTTNDDDWRQETLAQLEKSLLFTTLRNKCAASPEGSHVLALVSDMVNDAYQRTKTVTRHMREYTLHDGDHLFRVLHLMQRILPVDTIGALSIPELMLLILSAFIHDIGMAPNEQEVQEWLTFWDTPTARPAPHTPSMVAFISFVRGYPDRLREIKSLNDCGQGSKARMHQELLIADYIRVTHAERCAQILHDRWGGGVRYRDRDLTAELACVCRSHTEDARKLSNLDRSLLCGPGIYACLPFVGVVLRLADLLDFDTKRTPEVLFNSLFIESPVSLAEWNKHRAIAAWEITPQRIAFAAQCGHPAIEASIRQFCDYIDTELQACRNVLDQLSDVGRPSTDFQHYRLQPPLRVGRDAIGPRKDAFGNPLYIYSNIQFTLNQKHIFSLLMGDRLYSDHRMACRELIQNSVDACGFRRGLEESWGRPYNPEVTVIFSIDDGQTVLEVSDNGHGMDQETIQKRYATKGDSFYTSNEFYRQRDEAGAKFSPVSRFGIGVLSCFMVANSIDVDTAKLLAAYKIGEPLRVHVQGVDALFWIARGSRQEPGTTTTLRLRTTHPWSKQNDAARVKSVCEMIPRPPFPILVRSGVHEVRHDGREFSEPIAPTWGRSQFAQRIDCRLDDPDGLTAGVAAIVVLVDENGMPVSKRQVFSQAFSFPGFDGTLAAEIITEQRGLMRNVDSLEIRAGGVIRKTNSLAFEMQSFGVLAVGGMAIPQSVVTQGGQPSEARIRFPFPINFRMDIDPQLVDLHASRSHVIANEKWENVCKIVSTQICRQVRERVSDGMWNALLGVWATHAHAPIYLRAAIEEFNS